MNNEKLSRGTLLHLIQNVSFLALLVGSFLISTGYAQETSRLDNSISLDIPRNTSLDDALIQWGLKAGMTVMINSRTVEHITTGPIKVNTSAREALSLILRATGLSYSSRGNTITVVPIGTLVPSSLTELVSPSGVNQTARDYDDKSGNSDTPQAGESPSGDETTPSPARSGQLSEVIVTAQKREERLQDVPIPVTAVNADALAVTSQVRIQDYYTEIPGLSVAPALQSSQIIAIRGITTGGGAGVIPTVGITVDDIPFGFSTLSIVPDIDPGDLARIEVLRGPQGTLYGANGMGGLIKFVTQDPSTDGLSGRVEAGTSGVYNGAEEGYSFRGSVNFPVTSDFAIRASAFTRLEPGYIDNHILGIDGINEDRASGGHLAALWKPTDAFSVKFSAIYQEIKGDGLSTGDGPPGSGQELLQDYPRGVGPYTRTAQSYGLVLNDKLGSFDLTAVTGYNVYSIVDGLDETAGFGGTSSSSTSEEFFQVSGASLAERFKNTKLSQEIRAATPIGTHFDWLGGVFFTHEYISPEVEDVLAQNPTTGAIAGTILGIDYPFSYSEDALFTDLTYHVTDRFDVQVGGRQSHIEEINHANIYTGDLVPEIFPTTALYYAVPTVRASNNPFTYLLTPRFSIDTNFMVYGRVASGYRPGGTNPAAQGIPTQFNPDKTEDYEVGTKGQFLDKQVSVDLSAYRINWKDIQLSLANSQGFTYTGNAVGGRSEGVELSVETRPLTGLTLNSWVDWNHAILTDIPPSAIAAGTGTYAQAGSPLPYSPRFSANSAFTYETPMVGRLSGFFGGSASYVGARFDIFQSSLTAPRQYLPAYAKVDLRAGAKYEQWTVTLYVNNVTNRLGLLTGGPVATNPNFFYIEPRLVGLTLLRNF